MDEKYTGLDTVPSASQKSDIFNKTAINADYVKDRLGFFGAEIISKFGDHKAMAPEFLPLFTSYFPPLQIKVYDNAGFWSEKIPDRLIIPAGYSYAELYFHVQHQPLAGVGVINNVQIYIIKNDDFFSRYSGSQPFYGHVSGGAKIESQNNFLSTGIIPVTQGDVFRAGLSGSGLTTAQNWDLDLSTTYDGRGTTSIIRHVGYTFGIRGYKS